MGQELAWKVRSRENFSLFCINMVKITCFYTRSSDPGKIEKLTNQKIERKGWECILGENMIKCACGETGFRKEQSSLIGTGRKAG